MKTKNGCVFGLTVFAVSVVFTSCGGGAITMVKNGVLHYDTGITIGNALANNEYLSGGTWDKQEIEGRQYVVYTKTLDGYVCSALLADRSDNPRLAIATKVRTYIRNQMSMTKTMALIFGKDTVPQISTVSEDELHEICDIIDERREVMWNTAPETVSGNTPEDIVRINNCVITIYFLLDAVEESFQLSEMADILEFSIPNTDYTNVRLMLDDYMASDEKSLELMLSEIYNEYSLF